MTQGLPQVQRCCTEPPLQPSIVSEQGGASKARFYSEPSPVGGERRHNFM